MEIVARTSFDWPDDAPVDIATVALPCNRLQARIEDLVRSELSRFAALRDELVAGRVTAF